MPADGHYRQNAFGQQVLGAATPKCICKWRLRRDEEYALKKCVTVGFLFTCVGGEVPHDTRFLFLESSRSEMFKSPTYLPG
jgi:hypothetical protein